MFPLSEILSIADTSYRKYLAKKTGFILTSYNQDQLLHFWLHITKDLQKKDISFTKGQLVALQGLLSAFGYLPPNQVTKEHLCLESKVPWILRHPQGGIFLPLEVLKSLMQHNHKLFQTYLFSLLYQLKQKELHNLTSFIGGEFQAQLSLTFESHPLDMALVLYIWFASKHLSGEANLPTKGRLLLGPWSFIRETNSKDKNLIKILPHQPVPLWSYLHQHFPNQSKEIAELRLHIQNSRKGFYRPLSMVKNPHSTFVSMFREGFLFPLTGRYWAKGANVDDVQIICPKEIYLRYGKL